MKHLIHVALLLTLAVFAPISQGSAGTPLVSIVLGHSTATLNGPWKFHVGDDLRWTDPAFDDSDWEDMDLSAPADANDGDVGIAPYTTGWAAKGHPGYQGYAWYRLHLTATPPAGGTLALLGPWAVDSVYQLYENGALLGGVGDFSGATPTAHGNHYPRIFPLPLPSANGGAMVIAIRVWVGPWAVATGGIHVAPAIGERETITSQYHLQWLTIFKGYAVDVVPALLFFLMAVMVLSLWPLDRTDRTYLWLAAALVLSGIQRGNQAFFFWWEIETIQGFVLLILALTASLSLGAWMMAWRGWFKVDRPAWLPKAVAALTLILMLARLLGQPWLFHAVFPHPVLIGVHYLFNGTRIALLLTLALIVYQGLCHRGREGWYALPAVLAIGTVLFSSELSAVGVPGIWFPWGVGISLSEYASVVFDLLLAALLLRRLWSYAKNTRITHLESRA